jgi:NADH-quinone oxidoreductase subunit L
MLGPLVVLAFLSLVGGFLFNVPKFSAACSPSPRERGDPGDTVLTGISVAFGLAGIALSYYMYVVNKELPERSPSALGGLYTLVYNKYFVDEAYDATIVNPLIRAPDGSLARRIRD